MKHTCLPTFSRTSATDESSCTKQTQQLSQPACCFHATIRRYTYGSGLQVGPAAAAQSVAGLRGCETGCVEAGQQVTLDFQPRDSLGNVVSGICWQLDVARDLCS
jgi:hypothetical protein